MEGKNLEAASLEGSGTEGVSRERKEPEETSLERNGLGGKEPVAAADMRSKQTATCRP